MCISLSASSFLSLQKCVCEVLGSRFLQFYRIWRFSSSGLVGNFLEMAKNGVFTRVRRMEEREGGVECRDSDEVHVLAVDDSLVDRTVIERLLKITSCKVTAVDSGMRALQFLGLDEDKSSVRLDGLKVDLIITDYCMPGMTGYDLLKKIKGSSTFREIPVVIMSSENILARIHRCLEEGAEDFIVKPVKLADVKRLKSCMFGEGQVDPQDEGGNNKRKLNSDGNSSPESFSPSPSPPSTSSPSSPRSFTSLPSSPTSSDSENARDEPTAIADSEF